MLFSAFHTSRTWREYPVVVNTDDDSSAELLVVNNREYIPVCAEIDPIHPGITCRPGLGCPNSMECNTTGLPDGLTGFCRCTTHSVQAECPDDY